MLKAVIIDASAMSRDLLGGVLTTGGHQVVGHTNVCNRGYALVEKFHPHIVCIARDQVEDGSNIVEQILASRPKTLIFMVAGVIDAPSVQAALARGVHGFIVTPFKADTVLKTIRNTVLAVIKKQQG
jgi:two-component system chemotaxis response regulator CheY